MRIGTRASALALAQARGVAAALSGAEIVEVTTSGDRDRAALDKEKWVRELELALREQRIDAAVHSAKDVPTALGPDVVIGGVPAREDPRDALCGAASLDDLPEGARVGTSSLRRAALLRARRPDLEIVAVRGNVDTRLRRLEEGAVDALVLAYAGLRRLGRAEAAEGLLDPEAFVPAAGQGCLALECRSADATTQHALSALTDPAAERALRAERAVVEALGADCHSAVGAWASVDDGEALRLVAWVGAPDGSAWVRDEVTAAADEDPETLGRRTAGRLITAGAATLLAAATAGGATADGRPT